MNKYPAGHWISDNKYEILIHDIQPDTKVYILLDTKSIKYNIGWISGLGATPDTEYLIKYPDESSCLDVQPKIQTDSKLDTYPDEY